MLRIKAISTYGLSTLNQCLHPELPDPPGKKSSLVALFLRGQAERELPQLNLHPAAHCECRVWRQVDIEVLLPRRDGLKVYKSQFHNPALSMSVVLVKKPAAATSVVTSYHHSNLATCLQPLLTLKDLNPSTFDS